MIKKIMILPVLVLILLSFSVSAFSFSEFLNNFFGPQRNEITGTVVGDGLTTEQVTCQFIGAVAEQKCYTPEGKFACSGTGSCLIGVSEVSGTQLSWTSSCGGSASTVVDGNNEEISFKCETPAIVVPAPQTAVEQVKEQVHCTFLDSATEQKCYGYGGQFACQGIGSCTVEIYGERGKSVDWKSSCGGNFYTTLDGADNSLAFKCPVLAASVPSPAPSPTPISIAAVKEQVKCIFTNANNYQKCYTGDGKYVCAGIGSCINEVLGENGAKLSWKSSCGGYGYTLIDGNNENIEFSCLAMTTPIPSPTPVPVPQPVSEFVQEQVRCVFANSVTEQKCYSDYGNGCSGPGTCTVDVSGARGKTLTWKSSCGGYAYTTLDGNNKYAEFKCAQTSTPSPTPLAAQPVKEQVKCVFASSAGEQKCYSDDGRFGCSGTGSCVADVSSSLGAKLTWKSTCGGYAYTVAGGGFSYAEFNCGEASVTPAPQEMVKEQVKCIFANSNSEQKCAYYFEGKSLECSGIGTCIVDVSGAKGKMLTWKSSCGGYAYTVIDGNNEYAEFNCDLAQKTPVPAQPIPSTQPGTAKEQVRCVFSDPEYIQRCYADLGKLGCEKMERKCYTESGEFECSEITVASEPLEGGGFKYTPFCVAEVSGEIGTKLTWKSSCGGYAYTVIDGNNEDVEFNCVPSSEVSFGQISGKGFLHASWQCYDGAEEESIAGVDLTTCKSSEIWQQYARESCKNRCYPDGSKCGVNSFSVSQECYIDVENEGVYISLPEEQKEREKWTEEKRIAEEQKRAEEIEKRIKERSTEAELPLICKDSCPLEGKCYPFGYRKGGNYCPDTGNFVSQLKGEENCENNFECKSNVCIDGECISQGLIRRALDWFKNLLGEEEEEAEEEIIDCGASTECMEEAFKTCQPAKMSQPGGGPVSDIVIVGLEDGKCVMKMSAGKESMTCKFENYARGLKNIGSDSSASIEQYCSGPLTYRLTSAPKMMKRELPALNPAVEVKTPGVEETISEEVEVPAQTETLNARSACEKIREIGLRYKCEAMIKKDPSDCKLVEEPAQPYCYADVALVTRDSEICKSIKDSGHQAACEALVEGEEEKCSEWLYADYCYRDAAALADDALICDQIAYSGGKVNCKAVVLKDVSLCQNSDSEDCYQMLALLTGDETVCDELSKIQITGERPIAIANLGEEVSKCIKMAKKEITGCLFKSGSGTDCDLIPAFAKNPSSCENLKSDYPGFAERDRCYFYAALRLADLLPPELIVLRN